MRSNPIFEYLSLYRCLFLVLLPHSWSRQFAIDCTSHVCLDIQFHTVTPSPNHTLNIVASIAIWNRNKFAMVTALGLFGTNVAFAIQGKSLPLLLAGDLCSNKNAGLVTGNARVSSPFQCPWISGLMFSVGPC